MAGYGSDVWCTSEMVPGRWARGVELVRQACFRRLTTRRGALWFLAGEGTTGDAANAYGFDVTQWLGQVGAEVALESLPALVAAELTKDPRVASVSAEVALEESDAVGLEVALRLAARVYLVGDGGSFPLVMSISNVSAELLRG